MASLQEIREKMNELQKTLKEKQTEGHDLKEVMFLQQQINDSLRNRNTIKVLKLLETAMETLKNLS